MENALQFSTNIYVHAPSIDTELMRRMRKSTIALKVSKYGVISGPNTEKYGPEITPYLGTFYAVHHCT